MSAEVTLTLSDETIDALADAVTDRLSRRLEGRVEAEATSYLTVVEAAEYLRWPKDRLYKLTAAGAIPHRKHGNRVLLRRDELDRWLDAGFYAGPQALRPPRSPIAQSFQTVSNTPKPRIDSGFAKQDTLT